MSTNQEQEKLTKADFDQQIRDLIDGFFQSGGDVEEAKDVLEHHLNGAEYYLEDLQRSVRKQQAAMQQRQQEEEVEDIDEDSIDPVA